MQPKANSTFTRGRLEAKPTCVIPTFLYLGPGPSLGTVTILIVVRGRVRNSSEASEVPGLRPRGFVRPGQPARSDLPLQQKSPFLMSP